MTSPLQVRGSVHQNLHLLAGEREVHAVITVDSRGADSTENLHPPAAAEVLIIDTSGSMGSPPEKITEARQAAAAGIDALRDGVSFAVIAGSRGARMIWPPTPGLTTANPHSRDQAKAALRRLQPEGGTTIGQWLRLAGQLLGSCAPDTIRHAILLTDGHNQHETPTEFADALQTCENLFTCDCRGVGTDWSIEELRPVATKLHGTVQIVPEPEGLAEDFHDMMTTSMGKAVAEIGLRLWTPEGATVQFLKQVSPTLEDLTDRRQDSGPRTGDYPTASWGTESRDYHVCIEVEPGGIGDEKLAGRITFHQQHHTSSEQLDQQFVQRERDDTETVFAQARIRAIWTDDLSLTTQINPEVAGATGQAELANAIQQALAARRLGERDLANQHLTRARELAIQAGNQNLRAQLDQIYDPDTGTFQLDSLTRQHEMQLDLDSVQTMPASRR